MTARRLIQRMLPAIHEATALVRLAQTELSVRVHLADIARARAGLAASLVARDAALADVRAIEADHHRPPPMFLRQRIHKEAK